MSSATSIEQDLPAKAGSHKEVSAKPGSHRTVDLPENHEGFRPWHFFVLASLGASTAAVILSRQSAPEHLILISLTIGAAGAAAAAVYRTIFPLTVGDATVLTERPSERARATLEREKILVLRSIKELEFDRAMGKVSDKDFEEMVGRLRSRALTLMKQLDAGGSGYRETIERELSDRLRRARSSASAEVTADRRSREPRPSARVAATRSCSSCETTNDPDAIFCKRCGSALAPES